jgi:aspartate/methionine/tyrosine aminotransferase
MKINPFKLERYFARYEFTAPYLLSCSDCEPLNMNELLRMANDNSLELWNNLKLSYTESQGHPLLRQEIAKIYESIKPEDVVVVSPEEGIFISMNVLLEPGDHVICTFPGYQSLYEIAQSIGCEVSKWEPAKSGNFEIDDLPGMIKNKTRLIIINFPHNPTGQTLAKEELIQIINLATEKNIPVFSDEMYRLLEYNSLDRLPSVCDLYQNSISLFGLSKSFALPGLRLGWLTSKNKDYIQKIISFKDYTTICPPAPSEILAIIALQNKERILTRNLQIIKENLKIFDEFALRNHHFINFQKPRAGTVCFPELILNESVDTLCEQLINRTGIMLLPSSVYSYERPRVRIGFGRKDMPRIMEIFENFLTIRNQRIY